MTLNLSSRRCELIIGSQNWTNWISFDSGIILGYPEYEVGTGLMPVTGSINLKISRYDSTVPSSPNPRLNPSQWKRGQLVTIRIANTSGTLTYLPCSGQALYILKMPQKPKRNMDGILELSLEIGCRLALENFPPEPNQDISGITAGTPLARNTVITNILNYIDVANSINSIPYPIAYPLPKQTGNFIGFAGAIADSAGYYLRCNTSGTVIAEPISAIYSGSATASYVIGTDEKSWDAIGDIAEQPVEKLIVTGTVKDITPVDTDPKITESYKTYGELYPKVDPINPSLFIYLESRTTVTFDLIGNINGQIATKTEIFVEPYGLTYPKVNPTNPNTFPYEKSRKVTTYFLVNGIVYKTEYIESEAYGLTYPKVNPTSPNTARYEKTKTVTEWVKVKDGLWTKTTEIWEAYGVTYPDSNPTNPNTFLFKKSTVIEPDTSGPPTNFGDVSTNTTEEVQLKAEIFAQQLAADPYRPRQRTIDVPYTVEQAQLVDYGSRFNRILSGRAYGQQFGGAITDTALSSAFKPFADVAVTDADLIYYLKLDCIKWGLNGTEAWLVFNGIEVGTAPASTPTVISRPVAITLGNFNMIGLADLRINFNPIAPSTMIGLADLYINYNPIKPNTMIGLATL
jgi:hypothetical protein